MKALRLVIPLILIVFLISADEPPDSNEKAIMRQVQKFKIILELLNKNYLDSVDINEISDAAFEALLKKLDPQSVYYNKFETQKFKTNYQGSKIGIGVSVQFINDTLTVISSVAGSPADSAGMLPGDKILFINGKSTVSVLKQSEIAAELGGEPGSVTNIIIRRGSKGDMLEYNITRRSYSVPSINSAFLLPKEKIAYIDLNNISKTSDDEFIRLTRDFVNKGMKGMILDLRGNPGGYFDKSTKIVDHFLSDDRKITYTRARNKEYYFSYVSSGKGEFTDLPVIVLIDKSTASGSEIIAGTIQDYDRGLVVGEPSYGKGSVQRVWDLPDSTSFKATIAEYYIPSGRSIQKNLASAKPQIDPSVYLNTNQNISDRINELIIKTGGKSTLPLFKTASGRTVIGGGGIYPDYYAASDTSTQLTTLLNQKGIFLEFAFRFLETEREKLLDKYGTDFVRFADEYIITDGFLNSFAELARTKKVWNESMFQTDKEKIRNLLKATIANALWGNNGMKAVLIQKDKPLSRAIELIPEAKKMVKNP
jgi:carboxyl-terminal processing protease